MEPWKVREIILEYSVDKPRRSAAPSGTPSVAESRRLRVMMLRIVRSTTGRQKSSPHYGNLAAIRELRKVSSFRTACIDAVECANQFCR